MIREFLGKLIQKRFFPSGEAKDNFESEEFQAPTEVPDDVQEGHFAVLAAKGLEKKRVLVKIECANSPEFMRLLEQAEQEYGFGQTGALVIPCTPQELQKILNSAASRRRSLDIRINQLKQFLKQRFPNLRLDRESDSADGNLGDASNVEDVMELQTLNIKL